MRGERTHALTEAFTAYCAACICADPSDDVRPRVLAGVLVGVESSVVELWGRSRTPLAEILDAAERSIPGLVPSPRARDPLALRTQSVRLS